MSENSGSQTVRLVRSARQPLALTRLLKNLVRYKYFYMMLIPGLLYIAIFHYAPMFGLVIAFQDYQIFNGVWGSKFVGFDNFMYLFQAPQFITAMKNTFIISAYKIILGFPVPILLALLINEVRILIFKRSIQTILYLPHFLSWIVMSGLMFNFLSDQGPVNKLIKMMGEKAIYFFSDEVYFRSILVISDIWKEMGWNAIIYLAALTVVSQDLYEAAKMDGATRFQCMMKISLPSIMPIIMIMLLLRMGSVLNVGFEQVFNLYNPMLYGVGDIIDTYVYRIGVLENKFHISAAAGMFKSVIACIMVVTTYYFLEKVEDK
ncbi:MULTISPECIES: ABC transporter permease subunit [Paenibacillus]|uniref:ABC transporter permease subunit n=1 Tax=Paenibacillus violae TaxID=3077234 RepID=A0ABU3RG68_9BACL|nr:MULTISPECIES: ABC transporter permease subunit [Paenibacillus]MDU0203258.1 ABC transporter permease subunit [Paenibacillus sp. PFR10]MEC0267870.1 ABC transporter permease subunit [Paenibacillus anseongense]